MLHVFGLIVFCSRLHSSAHSMFADSWGEISDLMSRHAYIHIKVLFLPATTSPAYGNASFVSMLESNSGRNDVKVQSMWAMSNDFRDGTWGFFSFCRAPCAPTPAPPTPKHVLPPCPPGQSPDVVADAGDNGSCDCDFFCGSDWTGIVKEARPHWTGAASAYPGATTLCECVQATHWCPKNASTDSCNRACDAVGRPVPHNYCTPTPPAPPPPLCPTTSMVDVPDCCQDASTESSASGGSAYEITASGAYVT